MNSSKLRKQIYAYLGFHHVQENAETDGAVSACLAELETLAHFRYVYQFFETPPAFLNKQPYLDYLRGSRGVNIYLMNVGGGLDRRIKDYGPTDGANSYVLDECASAYLEALSDEYEKGIAADLSYRFCPGYGGSDVSDLRYIFELLKPEKIGLTLTDTNYMLPSKSMAGVIAVGGGAKKSCKNCIIAEHCKYKEEGRTCYGSENK